MKLVVASITNPQKEIPTSYLTLEGLQKEGMSRKDFQELWSKISNSQYKLFFTSFSKFKNCLLPVKLDRESGQIALDEKATLAGLSVSQIKLDPEKISNELLKNFGIINPQDRSFVLNQEITSQLRTVFLALTPVPGTNNRIQVITQQTEELQRLAEASPGLIGSLVYFRGEVNAEHKIAMRFSSIAGAHRKTLHEETHHSKEIVALTGIGREVIELRAQVGEWGQLDEAEKVCVKDFASIVSTKVGEQLKHVLLLSKILGRDQVIKSQQVADRTGRPNSSATWARLHAALDKFSRRLKSITKITTANLEDRLALLKYKTIHADIFANAEKNLARNPFPAKALRAFTDGTRKLDPAQTNTEITNYLTSLGLNDRQLSQVEARPYLTFKKQIESQIAELRKAAEDKNPEAGNQVLKQMHLTLQLVGFQGALDNLAEILTHGPVAFAGFSTRLEDLKSASQIFFQRNQTDLSCAACFSRELEKIDLAILAAKEYAAAEVTDKSIRQFKGRFFSKLSFEQVLLA